MASSDGVGGRGLTVRYDVPATVAFDYLVDPHHRPEWQSSLRRVDRVDPGPPRVGQRWEDHTKAGVVPAMETTVLVPGERWAETGTWRGFSADLELIFVPDGRGCEVRARFEVRGAGALRPAGWVLTLAALPAVRADLVRAGRLLARRPGTPS